jgi:voltage-gated potassium channel Kch
MKSRIGQRIRYSFDNLMARGLVSLIGLLGLASILFVFVIAVVVVVLGLHPADAKLDFPEAFWAALLRTLDPGTMGQDQGIGFRAAMLVVTLGGLVIVASLIGIISNAFNEKVAQLRKGRSRVLEKDHTLILGWNSKTISIVRELVVANASRTRPVVVILADRDKVEMEDEIHSKVRHHGNTRIVVRSGDPMSLADLEITNHTRARSIIILSPDDVDDADNFSIKTALALVNNQDRAQRNYHIVGEIRDKKNFEAATLVSGDEATWVMGEELISRLLVQTCRQSGLSAVFSDLLDFEGSEIYLSQDKDLVGRTYKEVCLSFDTAAVMGVLRGRDVMLNPTDELYIEEGDSVIVLAEDDSKLATGKPAKSNSAAITATEHQLPKPENTLILGDNQSLAVILDELDSCMAPGSRVQVISSAATAATSASKNTQVAFTVADPTKRSVLEEARVLDFNHIMVLADRSARSIQAADAKTLMTLLHLRAMVKNQELDINVVTEMLDDHNRELAEVTNVDDFIVSDKLVSLMLTQISENEAIKDVFAAVFSSVGSQVRLHPAEWYVQLGVEVDFNDVTAAANMRQESAMGYRKLELDVAGDGMHGVRLNPRRTQKVVFAAGDMVVVLTED